jgi:Clathrin light chain
LLAAPPQPKTIIMDDDDNYFASPPSDDAPIVLAPPSDDPFGGGGGDFGDFAAPADSNYGDFVHAPDSNNNEGTPAYLGDVNEAPAGFMMMGGDDADVLGVEDVADDEEPPVPTGPTPMQVWNEGWQALLLERKDAENSKKAELLQAAESELAAFQAEREQKREAAMRKNREDEQVKLEAIEADLENDNSWQRVCKMVELQHDSTQKSQDVKRMRDVMILLKNDPTKAQTLAA